ncbi:sigma-70 family RNA polymerase sigma factor [Niallia sp. 01092]|uniref:sigma-70 family RNA polymerase sigma factor n=1 Tax=unclassified Niallia TaxID=2837522 RepID=UPI003FD52DAC
MITIYNLVKKAQKGDEKAYITLFQQYEEDLYRIAYVYVRNKNDALDIVQETAYKSFSKLKSLKKPEYFKTWLIKIAINSAISFLRKEQKVVPMKTENTEFISSNDKDLSLHLTKEKKKHFPKWIIGTAASILIIILPLTLGNYYFAEAADTLINKIFGSKEELPDGGDHFVPYLETHLELAKKVLTKEEFSEYIQLEKEGLKIIKKMQDENRHSLTSEEKKKNDTILQKIEKYEKRIAQLTQHTFEEAQKMSSYPINRPTYIPEGYKLEWEKAQTSENNIGHDPTVTLQYRSEKFGGFITEQQKIDDQVKDTIEEWHFEHTESYERNGYTMDYCYYSSSNITGMRITVPDKKYKIVMIADTLSKEEMEKILFSMVEK